MFRKLANVAPKMSQKRKNMNSVKALEIQRLILSTWQIGLSVDILVCALHPVL